MSRAKMDSASKVFNDTTKGTKVALWWLRHYESLMCFWKGFSWVWVTGILLSAIGGYLELSLALSIILLVGVVANAGIYLGIRAMGCHLEHLEDGPDKEKAHEPMIQIIKRMLVHGI